MSPISITICFMIFAAVMFIWEKIPLAVTSMTVCLGLVVTGVFECAAVYSLWLFPASAMERVQKRKNIMYRWLCDDVIYRNSSDFHRPNDGYR